MRQPYLRSVELQQAISHFHIAFWIKQINWLQTQTLKMTPRVLLIGGHGKVSLLLTPMLLARSWNVTSLIRDPSQSEEILSKGKGHPGKVNVLVRSLEEVRSDRDAQKVLDEVKPDFVVFSAGITSVPATRRRLLVLTTL